MKKTNPRPGGIKEYSGIKRPTKPLGLSNVRNNNMRFQDEESWFAKHKAKKPMKCSCPYFCIFHSKIPE